ncbi:MAG: hypothetical protein WDO73_11480 [Ignavibacteriota bacterium]
MGLVHGAYHGASALPRLTPFTNLPYRVSALLLVAVAGVVVISRVRRAKSPAALALAATSAICFLLFCLAPEQLNGAYYFAERFPVLWVLLLLAAASPLTCPVDGIARRALCPQSSLLVCWCFSGPVCRKSERNWQARRNRSRRQPGSVGLMIGHRASMPDGLNFNPYLWSGVHYFRRSRAILANAPGWKRQSCCYARRIGIVGPIAIPMRPGRNWKRISLVEHRLSAPIF